MGISLNLTSYKTEEIEKLISEYPQINLREAFETCGKFLGEYYIILFNGYAGEENPDIQLDCWLNELFAKSEGKKLNPEEVDEEGYEGREISEKLYLKKQIYQSRPADKLYISTFFLYKMSRR